MQFVGSSSNQQHYEELNGTSTASIYGEDVRIVLETDDVIYHSASVTREFEDWGLTVLLGAANILDEEPPRVTTLGLGELETVGNSAFYSQYDWVGRRFFLNVTKTF
jgi:iron complex outermembrane receptor protein